MRYLGLRAVQSVFLLFGVSVLSFLFLGLAPGNFVDELKLNPQISRETLASLRAQFEMDRTLPVRYVRWLSSVARGEFGFSFAYNSPVAPLLLSRARNTLLLTGTVTLLAWLIALPLGILAAEKRDGWFDRAMGLISAALVATPELLLALVVLLLAVYTRWIPAGGMASVGAEYQNRWAEIKDTIVHLIAPVMVLVLGSLPTLFQHTRTAMMEALSTPYIRAARAHGIPRYRILIRHALPVAANPLISFFALSMGTLLSASLLVEVIMSWPGLGPFVLEAILGRDVYVVVGSVVLASMFLICGALLGDVLLFAVDPRIRTEKLV